MTDHISALDVVSLSASASEDRGGDVHSPLVVLLRDFRDEPAWIAIDTKDGQITRIHDFIAHRYRVLGQVGTQGGSVSRSALSNLLQEAIW